MKDDDIPVKTSEGLAEMKTRTLGLSPRMRTALLLVDGLKTVGELRRVMDAAGAHAGALETLFEKGLIAIPAEEPVQAPAAAPAPVASREALPTLESEPSVEPVLEHASWPVQEAAPVRAPQSRQPAETPTPSRKVATPEPTSPAPVPELPVLSQDGKMPSADSGGTAAAKPKEDNKPASAVKPASMPNQAGGQRSATSASGVDLKLLGARAHLASALDEHVGFQSYILKQQLVGCSSRPELESLYGAVEKALGAALKPPHTQKIIDTAKSVLGT
ncbi:hypothetical protein [Noviherbaspirillum massiliense]|uniref:hypothetical protein n=1 Tax=Noviherbaspirillum massiliense TaxID=1465823 RepID=UPI000367BA1E|nr:hypothetical protein [Noviherbaspirillum massiliense]